MTRRRSPLTSNLSPRPRKARQQGTFELDPSITVCHLLLRRDYFAEERIDALVAEFLRHTGSRRPTRRTPLVLWRGRFDAGSGGWPYWSLAVEEKRTDWYADLQAAANAVGLDFAMGLSTPHTIGAHPYLRVEGRSLALFDQRRRPNTLLTITLADEPFEMRTARYRYPAPVEQEQAAGGESNDLLWQAAAAVRLAAVRSRSAIEVWEKASDRLIDLSKSDQSARFSYADAVEFCESIGIAVVELEMAEAGRLLLEPLWRSEANKFWMDDLHVSIAIRRTLPGAQRRVALMHELGHYVHHLRYLFDILLFYYRMAQHPRLERIVAARWPSDWRQHRNRIMELDADYFSAAFVVPHAATSWLRSPRSPYDWTTVKGMILHWLHRAFDDGWTVGAGDIEAVWQAEVEREYDVAAPWFDRLARCVGLRTSLALVDMVHDSVQLENEMAVVEDILAGSGTDDQPADSDRGYLLERCVQSEIVAELGAPNRWDPLIVEPRNGEQATGYLPLTPMFTRGNSVDLYDWTRADGQGGGLAGTLEDWWRVAEKDGRGLMLFPMNPIGYSLRQPW